ncbi:FG-GAP and VCBS repeat-containing protein [Actinomadura scrupuli]|uniref:FG-GAP and VCBS repeat-containing protein n=1 Tax=Actinomadura scrupuli TaxID=559629 RepID=UPI003D953915
MHIRPVTVVGAVAAVTVGLTGLPAVTSAATAAAPAKAGDFNGDGRRDLALGSPAGTVGSVVNTGFVTVVYGGAAGPDTAKRQVVSQNSAGIPGGSEEYDGFGSALASADFDRDGYADLAIGAPGEDGGGGPLGGGRVTLVYGGPGGLSTRAVEITQGGGFGTSLSAGDFDGNGTPDLAVGANGAIWVYRGLGTGSLAGTRTQVGGSDGENASTMTTAADYTGDGIADLAASVYWSSISPDHEFRRFVVYQGSASGLASQPIFSEETSYADLAGGDFNGDGKADLVTGGNNEITVRLATGSGFGAARVIDQATEGVPGTDEPVDDFGDALSTGDVNGDGRADLAIGAPGEAVGTVLSAGAVTLLYGAGDGLTTTGAQMFGQDTAGVPGTAERSDRFGDDLALADVNGDGRADLTAGAAGENGYEGAVWVFTGSSAGISVATGTAFNPGTLGIAGRTAELGRVLLR